VRFAWIEARDFRNHRDTALEVPAGLVAVVGPNGHGKTNLLEALYYLCALESPRVHSDLPLIRTGASSAYLRGEVVTETGRFLIEVEVRPSGQNRVQVNRAVVRRKRDLRTSIRAVFSGPEDLAVIQGEPDQRRRFMDEAVKVLWPAHEPALTAYDRALRQRNRLLKDWEGGGTPPGLAAWDAELVNAGATVTEARRAAIERIRQRAAFEFGTLAADPNEALTVRYRPSVPDPTGPADRGDHADPADGVQPTFPRLADEPEAATSTAARFRARLAERRPDELIRRTTLVGPHRDDLGLEVQGMTARGFASHGEAWGAALSLRLALDSSVAEELGEAPVGFLDDPFSPFDPERRRRVAGSLEGRGQLFVAVPDEAQVPSGAAVWRVKEGRVAPE
jgi:DNA replication and repair protein RecF